MMTTIKDAYINALLADATYAISENFENQADLNNALKDSLGTNLADFVLDNFTLDQDSVIDSSEFLGSGFDASVWTQNGTNKTTLAMAC